jgi:hypothetical protein
MYKNIIFGLLFISSSVIGATYLTVGDENNNSTIIECTSSTILEITNNCDDSTECDSCCPDCPPVEACQTGYSCQPDQIIGEQQQYPPANVENWINTIVSGTLNDIPVNDSRWSNREEGEVYGRENDNYIVLWWPNSGQAGLDMTQTLEVGKKAKWYDYRVIQGGNSHSGEFIFTGSPNISFSLDGGGVTIFERLNDEQPPPTGNYFGNYINAEQAKKPANRLYPLGQLMSFSIYNDYKFKDIDSMAEHQLTAIGIYENAYGVGYNPPLNEAVEYALSKGLRMHGTGHLGGMTRPDGKKLNFGIVWAACDAMNKYGWTPEKIAANLSKGLADRYKLPPYSDAIDSINVFPEEYGTHTNQCPGIQKLVDLVIDEAYNTYPGIPLWRTETSGNVTDATNKVSNSRISAPYTQLYFSNTDNPNNIYSFQKKRVEQAARTQNPDRPNIESRFPGMIMDYSKVARTVVDEQLFSDFWITSGLIAGVRAFNIAEYSHVDTHGNKNLFLKEAYKDTVKWIRECDVDDAVLWGDSTPDKNKTLISGGSNLISAQYQYGNARYILLGNTSNNNTATVKLSNLPSSYKAYNCKSGSNTKYSGDLNFNLVAWGTAVYKLYTE